MIRPALSLALAAFFWAPAFADDAVVEAVEARKSGDAWTFSVTLSHGDTGWEDYADAWAVFTPQGEMLGERILLHPHVNEQPFTRSQGGIVIPDGLAEVHVRGRTLGNPYGETPFVFTLPGS